MNEIYKDLNVLIVEQGERLGVARARAPGVTACRHD